jgi:hypothetical protein
LNSTKQRPKPGGEKGGKKEKRKRKGEQQPDMGTKGK